MGRNMAKFGRGRKYETEQINRLPKVARILELHATGVKPKEIAERMGLTAQTIYRYLRVNQKFKERFDDLWRSGDYS